jgi:phosphonate transport system permease protein
MGGNIPAHVLFRILQMAPSTDTILTSYVAEVSRKRLYNGIALALFVVILASGFMVAEDRNAGGFLSGLANIGDFPATVVKESWSKIDRIPGHFVTYFPALMETLNIAAVSTLIGAVVGLLLSFAATRGLAHNPAAIPYLRRLLDVMRAIPDVVIALILIFVFSGGVIPAIVAISFHTAGALGKLFSEVNENVDLKPLDGLASTGASWSQKMFFGVIPQVLPNYLSYGLLRLEINIRASAILGFVGAGGIGYELRNTMTWGQGKYDNAMAIFILLFGTIIVVDQLSSVLRNRMTTRG